MKNFLLITYFLISCNLLFSQTQKAIITKSGKEVILHPNGVWSYSQEGKVTMESLDSPCYITNVFKKNGKLLITVDLIRIEYGTDEDGYDTAKIINNNKKLRTFIINYKTRYPQPYFNKNNVSNKLLQYIFKKNKEFNQDFNIKVVNGTVTELYLNDAG